MTTDFSIRRLLGQQPLQGYHWLTCSRYRPPKLSRSKKKDSSRRKKNSRTPRIPFTSGQLCTLEQRFQINPYLSSEEAAHLSSLLRLSDTRVKVWFQNRRARERRLKGHEKIVPTKSENRQRQADVNKWSAFRPVESSQGQCHINRAIIQNKSNGFTSIPT